MQGLKEVTDSAAIESQHLITTAIELHDDTVKRILISFTACGCTLEV